MSNYKIVKDADGNLVCFGPNTDGYEPTLNKGEIMTIETDAVALPLIQKWQTEQKAIADKAATDKAALLVKLGITAEEAALLLS